MLTVIIATHNGSATLARVLDGYKNLEQPMGGYHILIVDNGSTDETQTIINKYIQKLPISYIRIEQRGKNIALNEGIKYVRGDIVIFCDDDIVPDRKFLVKHREFADRSVNAKIWGGAIKPIWPKSPPTWIIEQVPLGAVFGLSDHNLRTGPIAPDMVWGGNMAVRSEVFEAGHRFDESIGPAAGQYAMGSDVEFNIRVALSGYESWFLREAEVGHIIREEQLEKKWILKRAFRFGKMKYARKAKKFERELRFGGIPIWIYRAAIKNAMSAIFFESIRDQRRAFKAAWNYQYYLGFIYAARTRKP